MTTRDPGKNANVTSYTLARRAMLAAAFSTLCAVVVARPQGAWAQPTAPLVTLQVIDRETGQVARVWRHAGKLYVAGQPGARYGLRVTNNSGGRILAVMSVDGVNILTGETAASDQAGYVVGPHETYDINGWRKSNNEVAAFNFAPLAGSYAAQTGRPDNVGVIGVAAFRERVAAPLAVSPAAVGESRRWNETRRAPPPQRLQPRSPTVVADTPSIPPLPVPPVERRVGQSAPTVTPAPADMARGEAIAAQSAKLGTGHGAREWSSITAVDFERASPYPQYVYRLEYDSRARLIASGVIPRPLPSPPAPSPFPGDRKGYVPDPPYGR